MKVLVTRNARVKYNSHITYGCEVMTKVMKLKDDINNNDKDDVGGITIRQGELKIRSN